MPDIFEMILRLFSAIMFGGLLGLDREYYGKPAGVRTYALVAVGSALFTLLSQYGFGPVSTDRVASQIVVGIGFLGAGLIIHRDSMHIGGLTTAAGLWVVAAIGMAFGAGWYAIGMLTALTTLIILNIFGRVRYKVEHREVANNAEAFSSAKRTKKA